MSNLNPGAGNGFLRWVLVGVICLGSTLQLQAADLKIEARLIWGTKHEKVDDPNCKPLDKETAQKLKKVFTWKNYFEVNRVTATVPSRKSKQFKMSPKCTIEVEELAGPQVAVTLIGDGKPVNKTIYPLKKGESINIAGEGKDGSAWFVLVTELDEK